MSFIVRKGWGGGQWHTRLLCRNMQDSTSCAATEGRATIWTKVRVFLLAAVWACVDAMVSFPGKALKCLKGPSGNLIHRHKSSLFSCGPSSVPRAKPPMKTFFTPLLPHSTTKNDIYKKNNDFLLSLSFVFFTRFTTGHACLDDCWHHHVHCRAGCGMYGNEMYHVRCDRETTQVSHCHDWRDYLTCGRWGCTTYFH